MLNNQHKVNAALYATLAIGIIAMTGTLWEVFTSLIAIITIGALYWSPDGWNLTWPILGGIIDGTDAHAVALAPVVAIAFYGLWYLKIKVDKVYGGFYSYLRFSLYNKEPLTETMVKVNEQFDKNVKVDEKGMALAKSLLTSDVSKLTQDLKEGNYDYGKEHNADVKGSEIKPGADSKGVGEIIDGGTEHNKENGNVGNVAEPKDAVNVDGNVGVGTADKVVKKENLQNIKEKEQKTLHKNTP